jgi:hypothetical protein
MPDYPIEDVHRLLEGLDSLLSTLRSSYAERFQIDDLPELFETVIELDGWRNTQYLQTKVGINGSLLNQILKMKGPIRRGEAIQIADRLRSYLRSHDQRSAPRPSRPKAKKKKEAKPPATPSPAKRTRAVFVGEQWVAVRTSNDVKMKISAIASLLDTIVDQIKHSNAPPEDQLLTDIDRQQLIAILETALHVLRAPLVEKGLLKKTEGVLKKGAESAAEKGVQQGLGKLMEGAGTRIMELIGQLSSFFKRVDEHSELTSVSGGRAAGRSPASYRASAPVTRSGRRR